MIQSKDSKITTDFETQKLINFVLHQEKIKNQMMKQNYQKIQIYSNLYVEDIASAN